MSVMFELYYLKPEDLSRELVISQSVSTFGGEVTCREDDYGDSGNAICLTIEFVDWEAAEKAMSMLVESGEHVKGPFQYGDD